jgi:hypothetical protein
MILNFKNLRLEPDYAPYPPYHKGDYLEEYFYNFYKSQKQDFDKIGYTLIPIFWTNIYLRNIPSNIIQSYIDHLPNNTKYFTVSQFDDGIKEDLPPNTINFVAGGNMDGIPIPLICSPIPQQLLAETDKDIFCSFVGTYVNSEQYKVRFDLYNNFSDNSNYYFSKPRHWDRRIAEDKFQEFINITKRSIFTLCPRGYGKQSFRLYEAIQLNSIPVFVYDDEFLPFKEKIDWSSFCVLVSVKDIPNLDIILNSISTVKQQEMLIKGKEIYNEYFTMEGMSVAILNSLKDFK